MKSAAATSSTSMIRLSIAKPADMVRQNALHSARNNEVNEKLPPISEKTAKNAKLYSLKRDEYFFSSAALLKNIAYTRANSKPPEYASGEKQSSVMAPQYTHAASAAANSRPSVVHAATLDAPNDAANDANGTMKAHGAGKPAAAEPSTGCTTCESRVYQDGSADGGVSYQGAKGMPTSLSGVYVASHEGEHATRESAKAQKEGDVITQKKVTVEMACCPDCGRMYAAGGTTTISKMDKPGEEGNGVTVQNAIDLLDPAGEKLDMLV